MASSSATITVSCSLIREQPRFLAYRRDYHFHYSDASSSSSSSSSSHLPLPLRSPLRRSLSAMTTPQEDPSRQEDSSATKTVRVVVKGKVQGVWYRNWTLDTATQLGLKGWVRNRKDGSVEALFSGTPNAVQEMEHRCRRGPLHAVVTGLEVFPCNDDPGTGFECKPTV